MKRRHTHPALLFLFAWPRDQSIATVGDSGRWTREVVADAVVAIGATSVTFSRATLNTPLRKRRNHLRRWT
jgi:hypothetical protein